MPGNSQAVAANAIPIYVAASPYAGVTPITGGGLVSGIVAKAVPGVSYGSTAALPSGTATAWLVGYNAKAVPADGAINAALVLEAVPIAAGPSIATLEGSIPTSYSAGIVFYITSGANPYANKVGVAGFLSAKVA